MSPSALAWALHSPRRFIAVLIGWLAVLVALAAFALRGSTGPDPGGRVERQRPVTELPSASTASATTTEHSDEEGQSIGPAARRTVDRFLKHYLAPTSRQELDQIRPLVTPDLWEGLNVADPSNMPSGPVNQIEKVADGAFTASFSVKLSSGLLAVDVVAAPDGLRVASVEPEEP